MLRNRATRRFVHAAQRFSHLWLAVLVAAAAARFPVFAADQTPVGLWKTFDDKTGKPRGFMRLFEKNGEILGKIESSLNPSEAAEICGLCSGPRKNKPVIGMIVMTGMKKSGSEYTGGEILDPDTGSVYRCKFHFLEDGKKLVVRGFIGFSLLGRSQTWIRQE